MYDLHYKVFIAKYGDTRLGRFFARRDARYMVAHSG